MGAIANQRLRLLSNKTPAKTQQTSFNVKQKSAYGRYRQYVLRVRVERSGYVYVRTPWVVRHL